MDPQQPPQEKQIFFMYLVSPDTMQTQFEALTSPSNTGGLSVDVHNTTAAKTAITQVISRDRRYVMHVSTGKEHHSQAAMTFICIIKSSRAIDAFLSGDIARHQHATWYTIEPATLKPFTKQLQAFECRDPQPYFKQLPPTTPTPLSLRTPASAASSAARVLTATGGAATTATTTTATTTTTTSAPAATAVTIAAAPPAKNDERRPLLAAQQQQPQPSRQPQQPPAAPPKTSRCCLVL